MQTRSSALFQLYSLDRIIEELEGSYNCEKIKSWKTFRIWKGLEKIPLLRLINPYSNAVQVVSYLPELKKCKAEIEQAINKVYALELQAIEPNTNAYDDAAKIQIEKVIEKTTKAKFALREKAPSRIFSSLADRLPNRAPRIKDVHKHVEEALREENIYSQIGYSIQARLRSPHLTIRRLCYFDSALINLRDRVGFLFVRAGSESIAKQLNLNNIQKGIESISLRNGLALENRRLNSGYTLSANDSSKSAMDDTDTVYSISTPSHTPVKLLHRNSTPAVYKAEDIISTSKSSAQQIQPKDTDDLIKTPVLTEADKSASEVDFASRPASPIVEPVLEMKKEDLKEVGVQPIQNKRRAILSLEEREKREFLQLLLGNELAGEAQIILRRIAQQLGKNHQDYSQRFSSTLFIGVLAASSNRVGKKALAFWKKLEARQQEIMQNQAIKARLEENNTDLLSIYRSNIFSALNRHCAEKKAAISAEVNRPDILDKYEAQELQEKLNYNKHLIRCFIRLALAINGKPLEDMNAIPCIADHSIENESLIVNRPKKSNYLVIKKQSPNTEETNNKTQARGGWGLFKKAKTTTEIDTLVVEIAVEKLSREEKFVYDVIELQNLIIKANQNINNQLAQMRALNQEPQETIEEQTDKTRFAH